LSLSSGVLNALNWKPEINVSVMLLTDDLRFKTLDNTGTKEGIRAHVG
jgi:hypothetical protein